MPKVARRFTIITLFMMVFALSFSALVEESRKGARQVGNHSTCDTISFGMCGALL
jgi:hypothetical protein